MVLVLKLTFQTAQGGNRKSLGRILEGETHHVSFSPLIFLGPKLNDELNIALEMQVTLKFGRVTKLWLWSK